MLDLVERFFYWFGSTLLEGDAIEHIQVAGALDDETLVTTSDDLMSVVEILGARKLVGPQEFATQSLAVAAKLSQVMKSGNGKQHSFGVSFRSDPESAGRVLDDLIGPSRRTSARLGIPVARQDYFDDQVRALTRTCSDESVYLVVLTHRSGLSPDEMKRATDFRIEARAKAAKVAKGVGGIRSAEHLSQTPRFPPPALIPRHASMVTNLIKDLKADVASNGAGLMARLVDASEGLAMMRRQVDASGFPSNWRPTLVGDARAVHALDSPRKNDQSALLPMPVQRQLVTHGYQEIFGDAEIAKCGSLYYASIVMEIPPESGEGDFDWVAKRIGRRIAWSASMEISPNGAKSRGVDQFYAGMVGGFGDYNKRVADAWKLLRKMNVDNYVVALRAVFTTWSKTEKGVVDNLSFLRSTLESWQSSVVSNETGEPALAHLSSAAGFTKRSPAPYIPGPLSSLSQMLPLYRPASVWSYGQLIAHTREGRPFPVAFGSSQQAFWGVLGFAPSGSGKSFALAQINYGILMSAGVSEIPPLVTIDVGPGSAAVLKLVRAMLPEEKRSQIAWIRVRNDEHHKVNPFDTFMSCDAPTEVDRDFQVAVLTTVCPNLGSEGDKFCSQVIKEAYRRFGRNSPDCRRWQSTYDSEIDRRLHEIGFPFTETTRVWDVEDWLMDHREYELANMVHRYAMPKLGDMVQAAQSKTIQDQYGGDKPALTPNGESMIAVFVRNVISAQGEYSVISGFTRFDVGNARAIAIDLEEVVGSQTSEEGKRRSGIMFLFARRLGARNFFVRWDELEPLIPQKYHGYHRHRVEMMAESLKYLQYDEKHYTTGVAAVDKQLGVDLRVGRKYKTVTMMLSQNLADFDAAAVNNCYTYFVMAKGSDDEAAQLRKTFGLSDSESAAIRSECTSPGRLFALFKTKDGDLSQILYTTAGPFAVWAFTTTRDEVLLRSELERRMVRKDEDYLDVLRLLTEVFPYTYSAELEKFRRGRTENDPDKRTEAEIFAERVMAYAARKSRSVLAA